MQSLEQKKIVISLPNLHWKALLSLRFFALLALLLFSTAFAYWYHNVRPYLWIPSAHLNAFSSVLHSDAAGRIAEMGPQEGDRIKKGAPLFSLDQNLLIAKQTQTKSALEALNKELEFEKEKINQAMVAIAELDAGAGTAENIQKQLGFQEEAQLKTEEAAAKSESLKKELALFEKDFKKTSFPAPFDGVILKRFANEGAVVSFGDPIYTLCDLERLWIEAEVPETAIGQISIGTPASIRLNAYPQKKFVGQVTYIGSATVAKNTQLPFSLEKISVPIKISIENSGAPLKPGLSAKVALKIR